MLSFSCVETIDFFRIKFSFDIETFRFVSIRCFFLTFVRFSVFFPVFPIRVQFDVHEHKQKTIQFSPCIYKYFMKIDWMINRTYYDKMTSPVPPPERRPNNGERTKPTRGRKKKYNTNDNTKLLNWYLLSLFCLSRFVNRSLFHLLSDVYCTKQPPKPNENKWKKAFRFSCGKK